MNLVLAFIYILVKFTDHSLIFQPLLNKLISMQEETSEFVQTFYIGTERIIFLAFLSIIFKSKNKYLKKMKNKWLKTYQSTIKYIAIKLYGE